MRSAGDAPHSAPHQQRALMYRRACSTNMQGKKHAALWPQCAQAQGQTVPQLVKGHPPPCRPGSLTDPRRWGPCRPGDRWKEDSRRGRTRGRPGPAPRPARSGLPRTSQRSSPGNRPPVLTSSRLFCQRPQGDSSRISDSSSLSSSSSSSGGAAEVTGADTEVIPGPDDADSGFESEPPLGTCLDSPSDMLRSHNLRARGVGHEARRGGWETRPDQARRAGPGRARWACQPRPRPGPVGGARPSRFRHTAEDSIGTGEWGGGGGGKRREWGVPHPYRARPAPPGPQARRYSADGPPPTAALRNAPSGAGPPARRPIRAQERAVSLHELASGRSSGYIIP